jgi:glutamate synthase (NADPH/NADH) small chain
VEIGTDVLHTDLLEDFDAICLTIGAREPRDLPVPGRDLDGIHFAVDFLRQQNKAVRGDQIPPDDRINAEGKHVIVIGGGDTGADCVGTSVRQGAKSITQLEILPKPPTNRPAHQPWPLWPTVYRTSTSHKEGCVRLFGVATQAFLGVGGRVSELQCVKVEWSRVNGSHPMHEVEGSQFTLEADLVLLAMGFVHPELESLVKGMGVDTTNRCNIMVNNNYMTSVDGVFAAGDSTRGPSLVVWAIYEGRKAAEGIHAYLMA